MFRLSVIALLLVVAYARDYDYVVPPVSIASAAYPEWAHSHIVWLSSSKANQQSETDFVNAFLEDNIPVGGVNIDSQWATADNNFKWDKTKYPDAKAMIDYFHSKSIRVILWATSFVNKDADIFAEGLSKGYYLEDGAILHWWHGDGAQIDYSNRDAVEWFHKQMDNVLDMGADGFKNDGTDPFVMEWGIPFGRGGDVPPRMFSERYYRDYFYYSRSKNPNALTMSRPVDSFEALAFWEFAPRDVVFMGWVGDMDPTWEGLNDCMQNYLHSAWNNYVSFGCDIGGYRSDELRDVTLFTRWVQLGAFMPVMENGGNGEHGPWIYNITDNYRLFATYHTELMPYLLTAGSDAFEAGTSIVHPIAPETGDDPLTFAYLLGKDIFVSPLMSAENEVMVAFPEGDDWVEWKGNRTYSGGSSEKILVPITEYPVYQRKGSMIPLRVANGYADHGFHGQRERMTFVVAGINKGSAVDVREWQGSGIRAIYSFDEDSSSLRFTVSAHSDPVALLLRNLGKPHSVEQFMGGSSSISIARSAPDRLAVESGWTMLESGLYIVPAETSGGVSLKITLREPSH